MPLKSIFIGQPKATTTGKMRSIFDKVEQEEQETTPPIRLETRIVDKQPTQEQKDLRDFLSAQPQGDITIPKTMGGPRLGFEFKNPAFGEVTDADKALARDIPQELKNNLRGGSFDLTKKEIDHIVPVSLGGTKADHNLQALSSKEKRQEGKVAVELDNILKFQKGELTQGEAIYNILQWQWANEDYKKAVANQSAFNLAKQQLASDIKGLGSRVKSIFTKPRFDDINLVDKGYEGVIPEEFRPKYSILEKVFAPIGEAFTTSPDGNAEAEFTGGPVGIPKNWEALKANILELPSSVFRIERGVGSGTLDTTASLIGSLEWAGVEGAKPYADKLQEWARITAVEDPKFADKLAAGVGSSMLFLIPGKGVMQLSGLVSKISPIAAMHTANGVMTFLESAAEAGAAYRESIAMGDSREVAKAKGNFVFATNTIVVGLTNRLGITNDRIKNILVRLLASVPLESLQEASQEVISNIAAGRQWDEGTKEAGLIGGIIGGFSPLILNSKVDKNSDIPVNIQKDLLAEIKRAAQSQEGFAKIPGKSEGITLLEGQKLQSLAEAASKTGTFAQEDIKVYHGSTDPNKTSLNRGDFVSIDKNKAKSFGDNVIEIKINPQDLFIPPDLTIDNIEEYIYDPTRQASISGQEGFMATPSEIDKIQQPQEGVIRTRTSDVVGAEQSLESPEAINSVENIRKYIASPNNTITEETVNYFRNNPVGVNELQFSPDNTITLYRDGEIRDGKPNSFSLERTSGQEPFTIRKEDIILNTNSQEFRDLINAVYTQEEIQKLYSDALSLSRGLETEVIAVPGLSSITTPQDISQTTTKDTKQEPVELVEQETTNQRVAEVSDAETPSTQAEPLRRKSVPTQVRPVGTDKRFPGGEIPKGETRKQRKIRELKNKIKEKDLKRENIYRKVSGYPAINEMTEKQLDEYTKALDQFQDGDEFLTTRLLQTVNRTNLSGIKTFGQARERLLKEIQKKPGFENITIQDLQNLNISALDNFSIDTGLASKNPYYNYAITRTQQHIIEGETNFLEVQKQAEKLAKAANKSRKRGIRGTFQQFLIPQHEEIVDYLEASPEEKESIAKTMTAEEIEYAEFIRQYYSDAYDHLVQIKELYGSRYVDQYFTHTRKKFLEEWKDNGLISAVRNAYKANKEDQIIANIIDQDTGIILPKSKFFQYTLERTGEVEPSKNVTRVFLNYARMFERKKMFDRMIPELDIYTRSLTPKNLTPKGLEMDRRLKTFMNKYLNNKKGRKENFGGIIRQNGPADMMIRAGNTFVSLIDLGLNVGASLAATVGEQMMTYQTLGKLKYTKAIKRRFWDTGLKRLGNKNANKILKDNEAFIGRNIWTELAEVDKGFGEKTMQGLFGAFSQSSAEANKLLLLGNLTKEELETGKISKERLAQLKIEGGRWRDMGRDMNSIFGSTSLGEASFKYKGWAIPILRTTIADLRSVSSGLFNRDLSTLKSKEAAELYRALEMTTILLVVGSYIISEEDDKTFLGKLKARIYQEAMTFLGGVDPTLFLSTPRLANFIQKLADNLVKIIKLEEYQSTTRYGEEGELKGVKGLQRQFTPAAIRQFELDNNSNPTNSGLPSKSSLPTKSGLPIRSGLPSK